MSELQKLYSKTVKEKEDLQSDINKLKILNTQIKTKESEDQPNNNATMIIEKNMLFGGNENFENNFPIITNSSIDEMLNNRITDFAINE